MATLTLDEIAAKARSHTISPSERRAQRVSLITGVLAHNSTLTREKVVILLNQIEGHGPESETDSDRKPDR